MFVLECSAGHAFFSHDRAKLSVKAILPQNFAENKNLIYILRKPEKLRFLCDQACQF